MFFRITEDMGSHVQAGDHAFLEDNLTPGNGRLALDVKDVVRLTHLSRAKIYQMWSQGLGPPRLKIGKRTLVMASALTAWLASQEVAPNGSGK